MKIAISDHCIERYHERICDWASVNAIRSRAHNARKLTPGEIKSLRIEVHGDETWWQDGNALFLMRPNDVDFGLVAVTVLNSNDSLAILEVPSRHRESIEWVKRRTRRTR